MFKHKVMSLSQAFGGSLQRVDGPVLVVPAEEPAGEGGRFKSLFDRHSGGTRVPFGRVAINVPDSWTPNTHS